MTEDCRERSIHYLSNKSCNILCIVFLYSCGDVNICKLLRNSQLKLKNDSYWSCMHMKKIQGILDMCIYIHDNTHCNLLSSLEVVKS